MKIIQISPMTNLDNYGAQRTHTLGIAKNMALSGNKVHLIVRGNKANHKEKGVIISTPEFKDPIELKSYFSVLLTTIKNNLKQLSFLKNLKNYDLTYERFLAFSFSSLLFSNAKDIPLIYEVNGIPDEELFSVFNVRNKFLKKIISRIIKLQLKRANCIIVQTKELKQIIKKKFNLKKIEIVPNGTDVYDFHNKKRGSIFKVCYIGELDDRHNLNKLFEAIAFLKKKFVFWIVGRGDLFDKYKLRYGKDKRFIFKGQLPHEEALKIIKDSDLCVTSNNKEYPTFKKYGFYFCPIKLLEYSMAGKPTILFESSNSFTRLFEKKNSCFIVNSKKDFVEKMLLLLRNPKLAEQMGKNARRLVERKFTWKKSAEKTEAIFQKVLKKQNEKTKK